MQKRIRQSGLCDVRIESILLGVYKWENTESSWWLSPRKTKNSNDGLQLKDKTAYVDIDSPLTRNIYFLEGAFIIEERELYSLSIGNLQFSRLH